MRKRLWSGLMTASLGLALLTPSAWADPAEPTPQETTSTPTEITPAEPPAPEAAPTVPADTPEFPAVQIDAGDETTPLAAPFGRRSVGNVHADVITAYWHDGTLQLGSQADIEGQVGRRVDPFNTTFVLSDAARTPLPAGFDFVGAAGSEVWLSTQRGERNDKGLVALWPGFSTEHLPTGVVDGDTVRFELRHVTGPADGRMELWQVTNPTDDRKELRQDGQIIVQRLWSSTDPQFDTITLPINRHMHVNWAFTQPGVYRMQVRARYQVQGQERQVDQTYTFRVGQPTARVAGTNRYATAAQLYFQGSGWGDRVVLASGENFADALAATPLAGLINAPLLLTPKTKLHAETRAALAQARSRGAHEVIIIGGVGAVSEQVEAEVRSLGFDVTREGGRNRYATATAIAERVKQFLGEERREIETMLVVDGTNFADALAAGPVAAQQGGVIVLSNGATLPEESAAALREFNQPPVAVGGAAARATANLSPVVLAGKSRYDTAALVALRFGRPADQVTLASGAAFPDALAAGAYAAHTNQYFLLTDPARVPAPLTQALQTVVPSLVTVVGGTGTVQPGVADALAQQLDALTINK